MVFYTSVFEMEAELTFVLPDDMRAPPFIFTGYRISHVHFEGLEEIGSLAQFELIDQETLGRGETGRVHASVLVSDDVPSRVSVEVRPGRHFYLLQNDRCIAVGTITAARAFRKVEG